MKKLLATFILLLSLVLFIYAQNPLHGVVVDAETKNPLPYVNIGIVATSIGTVSNEKGEFNLTFDESIKATSLVRLSLVGYKAISYKFSEFKNQLEHGNMKINMEKENIELKEVVIKPHKTKERFLGNRTESKMFGGGFGTKDVGSEIGVVIPVKNKEVYLENFNFFVSHNTYDSLTFCVKLYKLKDGMPDESILNQNVIIKIGKTTGNVSVDLTKYNILLKDDFLSCIEWLDRKGPPTGCILNISAGLFGSTYIKTASQGGWIIKKGIGLGINVKADITED